MDIELKPDLEMTLQRMAAFFAGDVLDRPVVQFILSKPEEEQVPMPVSRHATPAERWLDAGFQAQTALANLRNSLFPGDSLPVAWPNLGPDISAALYGCPLHFDDYGTSWSEPILHDWTQASRLRLDGSSPFLAKLEEMAGALLELGAGIFITGMISTPMFAEFFLPGIRRECRFLEHSIYHLDGPGAIRHLDLLLAIPELDAIQFVPTPGDEAFARWAPLYRRIQAGGKGVHFTCEYAEAEQIMSALRPEGLYLQVKHAPSLAAAEDLLCRFEKWTAQKRNAHS